MITDFLLTPNDHVPCSLGHPSPAFPDKRKFSLPMLRPPRYDPNFIWEFAESLSLILPRFDLVLIFGDFNIHVCCPRPEVHEHYKIF